MDTFMIYPIYFDIDRKLCKGRKYAKKHCFSKPTFNEINAALKKLGIESVAEQEKRHPCEPFVYGRFKIQKMYNKSLVIIGIKGAVEEIRLEKSKIVAVEEQKVDTKGYVKNELNLVPRKKNKGKKK